MMTCPRSSAKPTRLLSTRVSWKSGATSPTWSVAARCDRAAPDTRIERTDEDERDAGRGDAGEGRDRQGLHRRFGPERRLHAQGAEGLWRRGRRLVLRRGDVRPDPPDARADHH